MEKIAVIRPDVTPELPTQPASKSAANCAKTDIVDNCKEAVVALDADFRKKAAGQVAKNLIPDG